MGVLHGASVVAIRLHRELRRRAGFVQIAGHHVHLPSIPENAVVVDAGANLGAFSRELRSVRACRVLSLEPNSDLSAARTVMEGDVWLPKALGPRPESRQFFVARNLEASSLRSDLAERHEILERRTIEVIPLESLFSLVSSETIDVLKLDIEGLETEILLGAPAPVLRRIGQVSVEFHDFQVLEDLPQVVKSIRRMKALGFLVLKGSAPEPHHVDVLFLNKQRATQSGHAELHTLLLEPTLVSIRAIGARLRRALG